MSVFAARRPTRSYRRVLIGVLAASVGFACATVAFQPPAVAATGHLPSVQRTRPLPHTTIPARLATSPARPVQQPMPDSGWPAAGTAGVSLSSAGSRTSVADQPVGTLPVRIAGSGIGQLRVRLVDQAQTIRTGLTGVLLSVDRTGAGSGGFTLSLDYHGFRNAAGANFGDRARLVSLPACALSTPSVPACQVQTPVPYQNDTLHQTLSTTVSSAGASGPAEAAAAQPNHPQPARLATTAGATMVLAAVAGADGSSGAFSASSLAPSGSWSVSGASGSFHWGYSIPVPPTAAGSDVAPAVSLAYNSGSVDGHIASTNNQPSWLGEGWDYAPGYIERTYRSCSTDTTLPAASQTGDACWAGQIVTMSLGGSSTALVLDDTSHTWHAQTDADQRAELIGAGSGGYQGEYWRVTTADGVQYYFGRNTLPGGSAATATKSVYTEPVFGPHTTDPCYNAAGFAQSSCSQAWRWNLDYVVDPHANATAYYYTPETNYYGAHNATTPVSYTRGGYLREIDYGLRDAGGSTGIYGSQAPDRVTFTVAERCVPVAGFTCDPSLFTAANASHWPDTPQDQQCAATGTCNNHSPTFWSTKRLTGITTGYWTGTGTTYQTVDSYAFGQTFPTDGDPSLSLNSITRTGYSGATTLALPAITFASQLMDNRVSGYNNQSVMQQHRLTTIHSETGQITSVSYNQPGRTKPTCTATTVPTDESNDTAECFPVRWVPPFNTNPILDYFHKYVVTEVDLQDPNAIAPTRKTTYSYLGNPAWHYDDNEVVKPANRTWGQFRGYQQVEVRTGNESAASNGTADQWTLTTTTYYRGMNGDTLPNGGSRTGITVPDSHGGNVPDDNNFADMAREVQTFNGDGGAEVSDTVTTPTTVATTATRARTGLPALTAHIVAGARSQVYTAIAAGGWQEHDTDSNYDAIGRLVGQTDSGTGLSPVCTTTSYADNTTSWIRDLVAEKIVSGQTCPTSGQPSPILADTRTYYDSSPTLGAVPGAGNPTTTLVATDHAGPPTAWAKSTAGFDTAGRQTSAISYISASDPTGRLTSTSYTLTAAGQMASVQVTNAASQPPTITSVEPGRGLITETVDVAGHKIDASYDPLGRVTSVWQPGQVKGTDPASTTYSYLVRSSGPLTVTTKTLIDVGNSTTPAYKTSVNLFDAFGSLRQTQVDAPGGGRVVVDSFNDSHGWTVMTNNRWYTSGVPGTDLVTTAVSAVDDRTVSNFDGTGRPLLVSAYRGTTATSATQTVYGGDRTTTIPPSGGVETTAVFDARGETVESDQWTSLPTFTGNVLSGGTASRTTYHYTSTGLQDQLTSAAGTPLATTWTASYDLAGRPYHKSDPDAGTTDLSYYDTGELKTSTDANNQTVTYNYDGIGRKLSEYLGGTEVASWLYDTLQAGQQTSSTRYTSSGNYTVASTGYDNYGNPSGISVQLPASETGFASSYTTSYTWTTTHLMATMKPADGGSLPSETIKYTYDPLGNPTATAGYNSYVSATSWSSFSEPNQYKLGTNVQLASLTYTRDPQTHRVLSTDLSAQTAIAQQEHTVYSYDLAGNITQTVDTQGGGSGVPVQTQCYRYTNLDQLSESWSATDGCAADPATAGNTTVGGPQPYWTSWTFDATGGRYQQVQHGLSGASDSTTSYTNGLTGHAHALASAVTTGPGAGTSSFGYDADGNTNLRTLPSGTQTLGYTYDGHTDTVAGPAGNTDYRYDADGNQLVRHDPTSTTVFLPGEELTRNTSTGTIVGTRYYSHNGTVVSVRVGHGNQSYLYANQTGSNQVSLPTTSTGTGTPVRKYLDPFGNPLGAVTGGSWPDQHGFLNKPQDAATGLTDVGSRQYDPTLGRFTSVDPVLDPRQPQQANGYSYALNNPVSNSDPTGMDPPPIGCENTACYDCLYADINCDQMKQAPPPPGSGSSSGGSGGGSTTKPVSSPLPKIPPDRLKVLRADIQMYMKDSPNDWNVPGSFAYQALMVRIRWAIYGPLTFDDILKAAKGPAVAFVVGLIGAALCPESAGAGCLVAVGAVAGAAGACASDCSNVTSVALSAVAGAIVGAAGGAGGGSGLETGADQAVFWSGIKGSDAGAAAWVGKNGGVTLETTLDQRGITLPEFNRDDPSTVSAWRQASAAFARGAQGNVIVLQGDAVRTTSVWAEVEYPALTANPNVTSITAINPETGDSTLLWSR